VGLVASSHSGRITGNREVVSEQIIASGWPTTRKVARPVNTSAFVGTNPARLADNFWVVSPTIRRTPPTNVRRSKDAALINVTFLARLTVTLARFEAQRSKLACRGFGFCCF